MTESPDSVSAAIATLQTPPGRGGIAVIYVEGPGTLRIIDSIFRPYRSHARGGVGLLQLGRIVDKEAVIDETIVHHRASSAEINIHGSPEVARAVLELLGRCGATIASGDAPAAQSFPLSHPKWNNPAIGREMLDLLPKARSSLVVATLSQQWSSGISRLARADHPDPVALREAADRLAQVQRLLEPPEVVLTGPPNVGKSTLTNALLGRNVSIVHDRPGTTRDWVRELGLFDDVPIYLTDTAGIWSLPEGVDAEAVRRARKCVERAHLVLLLSAGEQQEGPEWLVGKQVIRVGAKCDVCPGSSNTDVNVSAVTGEGLQDLKHRVLEALEMKDFDPTLPRAFIQRQSTALLRAADALETNDPPTAKKPFQALLEGDSSRRIRECPH